jgi:transcriptional regulator with XRE-family HTH domain
MAEPAAAFSFNAKARFADNLYRARERAGLSQKDAAARAALTPPASTRLRVERRSPASTT